MVELTKTLELLLPPPLLKGKVEFFLLFTATQGSIEYLTPIEVELLFVGALGFLSRRRTLLILGLLVLESTHLKIFRLPDQS
jgi:hypothetical protein